jgi:hypothetical protein
MKPTISKRVVRFLLFGSLVCFILVSLKYVLHDDKLFVKRTAYKLLDKHIVEVKTDHLVDPKQVSIKLIIPKGEKVI